MIGNPNLVIKGTGPAMYVTVKRRHHAIISAITLHYAALWPCTKPYRDWPDKKDVTASKDDAEGDAARTSWDPGGYIIVLWICTAVQSQKAVSAYFTSKQILPFGFAEVYDGVTGLPRHSNPRKTIKMRGST